MAEWLKLLGYALRSRFKSRARIEAENLVLRQQVNILVRRLPKRVRLTMRTDSGWFGCTGFSRRS